MESITCGKKCLHLSAKFRISLQNFVKNLQNPAFFAKLWKMLQSTSVCLHFTVRLFKLSGHSLLVSKMSAVSLHCSRLCNFIASADFYHFSALSCFENFLRNKLVILNICAVAINKINPYHVHHIEKVLVQTVVLRRWRYIWVMGIYFDSQKYFLWIVFFIKSILKYRFLVISITRKRFLLESISKWIGTEKNWVIFNTFVTWVKT